MTKTSGGTNRQNGLSEAAREAYNAYMRQWKRKNPGKVKEYQNRFWEKRAAEAKGGT